MFVPRGNLIYVVPQGNSVETKLIKVRMELYYQLVREGKLDNAVLNLIARYDSTKVTLKQNADNQFLFCVNGKEIPYVYDGELKVVRVSMEVYKALLDARMLPEEGFSSVIFRLITASKTEKPYLLKVAEKDIKEWLKNNFKFPLCEWLCIPFPEIIIKDNIGYRNAWNYIFVIPKLIFNFQKYQLAYECE